MLVLQVEGSSYVVLLSLLIGNYSYLILRIFFFEPNPQRSTGMSPALLHRSRRRLPRPQPHRKWCLLAPRNPVLSTPKTRFLQRPRRLGASKSARASAGNVTLPDIYSDLLDKSLANGRPIYRLTGWGEALAPRYPVGKMSDSFTMAWLITKLSTNFGVRFGP